jgi:hypothetical protein
MYDEVEECFNNGQNGGLENLRLWCFMAVEISRKY